MEATGFDDRVVLGLGRGGVRGDGIVPVGLGDFELLALVVESHKAGSGVGVNGAFRGGDRTGDRTLHEILTSHELRVAAKQDIGTAAGHVGGDGDHAEPSRLRDDFGFFLVELRVQHDVTHALATEDVGKQLGLLDRSGADQYRLLGGVEALDLIGHGEVLFLGRAIDHVRVFDAQHLPVGRDDDDLELVDGVELRGLGFCGSGHAGKLLVKAEVVLEGDGGERLVFLADLHAFLGFDGLMEAVGPAAAGHEAAREFVDDDDFAVLDDVLDVALVKVVGLERDLDVVLHVPVVFVGNIVDAEKLFNLLPALVGDGDGAGLLVDDEIAGPSFGFQRFDQFAGFELGDDAIGDGVLVGGLIGRAGDDERGAGFVDQDGVDFVHDAEVVFTLHHFGDIELHVVAQVIEAELIVGAVGDVGSVGLAALLIGKDHAR